MGEDLRITISLPRKDYHLEADLSLPSKGISVVLGASGSGKTSVLRCIAGLEQNMRGLIQIESETWHDDQRGVQTPAWKRSLGFVFQEPSLFPHLNVRQNVLFGQRRLTGERVRTNFENAVSILDIHNLLERRPPTLSGGEQQRVALARAIVGSPRLLLLDEPLASIDQGRREEILPWLERVRDEFNIPMLYVTHSPEEMVRLADNLVILERGKVVACGPVVELLSTLRHSALLGEAAGALIEGQITERDEQWHLLKVAFPGGTLWVRDTGLAVGHLVRVRILARDVSLTRNETLESSVQNQLQATVTEIIPDVHSSHALVQVRCGSSFLLARLTRKSVNSLALEAGSPVWAQVKSAALLGSNRRQ